MGFSNLDAKRDVSKENSPQHLARVLQDHLSCLEKAPNPSTDHCHNTYPQMTKSKFRRAMCRPWASFRNVLVAQTINARIQLMGKVVATSRFDPPVLADSPG